MSREPSAVSMSDTLGRTRRLDSGRQEMGDGMWFGIVQDSWDSAKLLFFKPTSYEGYRSETNA